MVPKLLTPEQKESRMNICADILNIIDSDKGLLDTVALKGPRFESVEAVKAKATEVLNPLTEADFHCFQQWKSRMERCRDRQWGLFRLFQSTPCKHPVIVLQDVAWTDLHALVEFIYHGEVNVHQRSLSSFLKTAEVLRVSGLTQQHGDGRDQLAQVQSMVRSQQQSTPLSNHHPSFTEKLVEDALFTSPSSPPHGATVNQLLRRAAMQYRRERRISTDPDGDHKRPRPEHIIGNNNNNELNLSHTHPPQTQPADFSPSAMKNSALNLNLNAAMKSEAEGNGISSTERENSPCSPSPTTLHSRCNENNENNVKNEPMELICSTNPEENSNDSTDATNDNGPNNLPQGPHSGSSGGGDHEDHDSTIGPYLTPSESKLFATAAGSFNFSMAALAADHTGLGGLNQSLQAGDGMAGTSQGGEAAAGEACNICGKVLRNRITLRRHVRDLHYAQTEEFWCKICNRCYRTKNSLVVHTCNYHQKKAKLKRSPVSD
ncbi:hypothetical protein NQ318_004819 [Aromia moschata]|uniref:C2H2-type domain-containing protein n=1 Tax=Aromia moschata TaxID=1265417 RepID=A0AAV8Z2P7_9CUCU|nr:hypothetical protein NQ318_004819 [Aromia moschata]